MLGPGQRDAHNGNTLGRPKQAGWLRPIVSVSPINGLMLLAWSGAFLYAPIRQRQT